jgi:TolB-like protein/Flp pilus assembly protein TadD
MKPPSTDLPAVSSEAILLQLAKILASPVFQGAERSTKLLRYLVEQTANGHADGLKEYTLGAEALGKGSSFDPRTDTIVRAEATRLRNRLEKYYDAEGRADPIVISLPRGSYVPRFQEQIPPAAEDVETSEERKLPPPARLSRLALVFGVAACVFAGIVTWTLWHAPVPDDAVSIAVLPFANLSTDPGQEFFSDGITDEISGVLAKIPDLHVVGRSSVFQFKGKNKDLRTIGRALGATHLIEGSVRKEGSRVRISVQLAKADSGLQIWSDTYDRALTDVFAIQEDIAKAIAMSLRTPLGLHPGEWLISNRIADPDVYELYLRGRAQLRARRIEGYEALTALVARAPGFAPGWAMLANAYGIEIIAAPRRRDFKMGALFQDKAEAAARKAIELDPADAGGYSELAAVQTSRGKWTEAEDLYRQALALDPSDSEVLHNYSQTLFAVGRLKEALRVRERLHALEPLVPIYNQLTAGIMQANGQVDASIAILENDPSNNAQRNINLAEAYAIKGRFAGAANALLRITFQIDRGSVESAARLLDHAPSTPPTRDKLPALDAELGFVYAYIGAPERMLDYPETAAKEGNFRPIQMVWRPSAAPLRKTERFKAFMRQAGLVDHWRMRGWPDLCRPANEDDFVCE